MHDMPKPKTIQKVETKIASEKPVSISPLGLKGTYSCLVEFETESR
jgi:hypothetical protein